MEQNTHQKKSKNHCLIFDPIPFFGGSKLATQEALNQCDNESVSFTVLTVSPTCWESEVSLSTHQIKTIHLRMPPLLFTASHGGLFWVKQFYFSLMLFITLLRIPPVNSVVGMSGPGVDMSLYLVKVIWRFPLIQLIHGPVAKSRSIGHCLTKADVIFALESCHPSIQSAFSHYFGWRVHAHSAREFTQFALSSPHYLFFNNGISSNQWPTSCTYGEPRLFWAASLLKWKGLDTLIETGKRLGNTTPIPTDICYIKPERTQISITQAPIQIPLFSWHKNPRNLDELRARNNVFVSTSQNEPFGLSILEAMAAGMCVVIPNDGAYWDSVLTHKVDCIKYKPNDSEDLFLSIQTLIFSPFLIPAIGQKAKIKAENYHAEQCYRKIARAIVQSPKQIAKGG